MTGKYEPLSGYLAEQPDDQDVTLSFDQIDALVRGLPPSASQRQWWANAGNQRGQCSAWMGVGRIVSAVDLGRREATFSAVGVTPRSWTRSASPANPVRGGRKSSPVEILDGVNALSTVLERAGYPSVLHAVAAHTVFLDPGVVGSTNGAAVFPVVRDPARRGQISTLEGFGPVLLDDNTSPKLAFLWAADRVAGPDIQFNHIWGDPRNPYTYTALWNLCVTPAFLAKTTDGSNHPEVIALLRHRSWELYGCLPEGESPPADPVGDGSLTWALSPPPIDDLEAELRRRLSNAPKSRPAIAAREIGWCFSHGVPDSTLPVE